jgi:hypothetical protein
MNTVRIILRVLSFATMMGLFFTALDLTSTGRKLRKWSWKLFLEAISCYFGTAFTLISYLAASNPW